MNLNKKIFYLIFEIFCLTVSLIFTNIFWSSINQDEAAKIAYAYSNVKTLNLKVENKSETKHDLKITNENDELKKYNIYFKTNNNDNKKEDRVLIIDDNILNLDNLENFTKGNYIYYLIKRDTIKKKSTEKIKIKTNLENVDFKIEEI